MTEFSREEILAFGKIDPEFEEHLKKAPPLPKLRGPVDEVRANINAERAKAVSPAAPDDVLEEVITVPAVKDGFPIPVRLHKPKNPSKPGPLIVLVHGGGFVFGTPDSEALRARAFVQKFSAVVLNVDYRLAPEHPFPTPQNDCWDVTCWAAKNAAILGADPSKGFIVGGTSAGGQLAATVAYLARDEKLLPPLTGLLLMVPALLTKDNVPEEYRDIWLANEQNKDAPILDREQVNWFMGHLKPDYQSHLFTPFRNPNGLGGLPPTVVQASGLDPLRDDAIIFEKAIRKEGVKTVLKVYPGLPHAFSGLFPTLSPSKKFTDDAVGWISWLLDQGARVSNGVSH